MASTAWNANATSGTTVSSVQSHSIVNTSTSTPHQQEHQVVSEYSQKRVRLAQDHPAQSLTNGFVNVSNDKSTMGWPFRPDIMQKFRCTFDDRFKGALKDTLSPYFTRLKDTEEAVATLKTECKELEGRITFIENTSKDLKASLSERVVLPAPTTGVGQRRTLSSQAPRLPPVTPTTVAAQAHVPSTTAQSATPLPTKPAAQASSVSPAIRPIFHPTTCASASVITTPPTVSKSTTKPMPPQPTQNSVPHQPQPKMKSLTVRPADMIDLTSEPSPNSSAVDDGTPTLKNPPGTLTYNVPNQRQQPQQPVSCVGSTLSRPAVNTLPTTASTSPSTLSNQKIAWFTAHTVPVSSSKSAWIPVFQPKLLTYQELQRLPVAPLPPTPLQQPSPHPPVQPMPQLTIAEAAEGMLLTRMRHILHTPSTAVAFNLLRDSANFQSRAV
ncbi:unnamed protein product [Dicrocoelium dendriticum]|nr:unnamed protein product [Dicrocoelium dendriticum]